MAIITLLIYILSPIEFADSLFNEKDFFNAITEYKRAMYIGENKEYALWKIGLSYEKRKKYNFAAKYFSQLAFLIDTPTVKHHLAIDLIKDRRYKAASLALEGEKDTISQIIYAISEGLNGNFQKADTKLKRLNIDVPSLPDDNLIRYPSYIVPGFGLFILGDCKKGLLSLFFTGTTGYITYYLIKNKRYPEAFVCFNTLFLRFYTGGIKTAFGVKSKKKRHFYSSLLDKLLKG